jgi:hypothetical protein
MGVAFLALVLAVSGTAVALPGKNLITSDDLKKGAVKGPDIGRGAVSATKLRNGAVSNAKLANGAVGTGKLANDAVTGEKVNEGTLGQVPSAASATTANSANTATTAGSAPPHAYAKVSLTGSVEPATAKNITSANVTKPGTGVYCFDLPYAPVTVLTTPENDNVSDDLVSALIGVGTGCPAGTEVSVQNYDISAGALEDDDFYIWLN